jgi:hypothetical protein
MEYGVYSHFKGNIVYILFKKDSLRVALPAESPLLTSNTPPSHIQQPESVALPVAATSAPTISSTGGSSSAPSSSAPLSMGIDSNELAKIRAGITLRRLNQQQQTLNSELGLFTTSNTPVTTRDSTTTTSSRLTERTLPSLDELLARRRIREAQSPGRLPSTGISAGTQRNTFDLFEAPATTNSGASITVCY